MNKHTDKRADKQRPEPITVSHSQGWEIVGFFAMLASFCVLAIFGNAPWAFLLMLFAIFCAAMR